MFSVRRTWDSDSDSDSTKHKAFDHMKMRGRESEREREREDFVICALTFVVCTLFTVGFEH